MPIPKYERLRPWLPLSTQRLLLREFQQGDFDAVHAYGSDPEVARFMVWGPNTPEDSQAFLDRTLAAQAEWPRASVNTAVVTAETGRLIGSVELRVKDSDNLGAEIGWCLHQGVWGQGYAREAASALLDQAFGAMGLHRVIATCDIRNRKSWRALETLGLRREALFRKDIRVKRRWRDTYLYAILKDEWRAREARQ
jgi:RimJ/RimL family protein N-acetyltransferase